MMLSLVVLLHFMEYCTAEVNIAITENVNLNLTIGNYTESTVTSCKMRCARNSNCASIAFKELPNAKHGPFVCYLLQNQTDGEENKEVEFEKIIVVDKVEKFLDEEKRKQTNCQEETVKPVFSKESLFIRRSQKLVTLERLYKSYKLTFEVYLNKNLEDKRTNIIHMTIGENFGRYGARTPAIFLSNHSLSINSAVNGHSNFDASLSIVLQKERWYKITVSQIKIENPPSFIYRIEIDGKMLFSVENKKASEFENVSLYASNPWIAPAYAEIRNLALYTSLT